MLDVLETPLTVVHIFVCVLLMLVVLIQPGKSGGLGAAMGGAGAQQLFGGRGAGNFLSRATWISAVVFFVTSISLAYIATSTGDSLQEAVAAEPEPTVAAQPAELPAGQSAAENSKSADAKSSDIAAEKLAPAVPSPAAAAKPVVKTQAAKAVTPKTVTPKAVAAKPVVPAVVTPKAVAPKPTAPKAP